MKKLLLAIIFTGFSINALAINDANSEVQMDSFFESNQNTQLQTDNQYAVQEAKESDREAATEQSRVKQLQRENDKLTGSIKNQQKLVKARKRQALMETRKAQQLERQAARNQKQVEKLKIANVNLRKSIEKARTRQKLAVHKLRSVKKHSHVLKVAHKQLKGKKQAILKRGRSSRIRTASL